MNNNLVINSEFIHPNPATFDFLQRQYFSLPFGIISYITQNPISADGISKLQKTCKYFFAKNKIIIAADACLLFNKDGIFYLNNLSQKIKLTIDAKYWLTNHLYTGPNFFSKPSTKMYRCLLHGLDLHKEDNISLKEFDFLVYGGKISVLRMYETNIYDENKNLVSCDKILSKVPNLVEFYYQCENNIFTTEIFKNMKSLEFNFKFTLFQLPIYNLSEDADIKLFSEFIIKNYDSPKSSFYLYFMMNNGAQNYQSTMQFILENMLGNGIEADTANIFIN